MTFSGDPYRTLGLVPGASPDDVKRAYRRLAKQYHPDAAGPDAVARFLAIQGAYEALADPALRGRPQGRATSRASEADPDRARATREAYRAGRSAGWGSRAGAGSGRADDPWRRGTRRDAGGASSGDQGARAKGTPGTGPAGPGTSADAGAPGGPHGTGTGASATGAAGGSSRRSERSGAGTEAPGPGGTPGAGRRPSSDRGAGRKASRRKATLTSTSYDDAAQEPRHPEWQGSSWYGTSSGTYWTINPREYADPRKHGPEYQARARRATDAGGSSGPERAEAAPTTSASFEAVGGAAAWGDEGIRAAPGSRADASGTGHGACPDPHRPASGVPWAGSIGLLTGALAAIPASVVALGSMMSGDLSLAATAIAVPFVVAAAVALAMGIAGHVRS